MRRRQLADSLEHRVRSGHVAERLVQVGGFGVQPAELVRIDQQRLDLRGEPQLPVDGRPEERLLARAVAREDQRLAAIVPDGEPEHALEPSDRVPPVPLVEGNDVLDVPVRAERIAPSRRLRAQLARVVDLAVADHPDRAVGALKRLVASREVHDGEAPRAEAGALVPDDPLPVRAAVLKRGGHLRNALGVLERRSRDGHRSEDAAHNLSLSPHRRSPAPRRGEGARE